MSKTNKALQISISILCALLLVASFLVVLLPTAGHTVAQAADLSTRQSRLLYFLDRNVKGNELGIRHGSQYKLNEDSL